MTNTTAQEIEALCQRLYNQAIANGANDDQAIKAIRLTIAEYLSR